MDIFHSSNIICLVNVDSLWANGKHALRNRQFQLFRNSNVLISMNRSLGCNKIQTLCDNFLLVMVADIQNSGKKV